LKQILPIGVIRPNHIPFRFEFNRTRFLKP